MFKVLGVTVALVILLSIIISIWQLTSSFKSPLFTLILILYLFQVLDQNDSLALTTTTTTTTSTRRYIITWDDDDDDFSFTTRWTRWTRWPTQSTTTTTQPEHRTTTFQLNYKNESSFTYLTVNPCFKLFSFDVRNF